MKWIIATLFIFILSVPNADAQIKELHLTCNQTAFDYIYANYDQDIYIAATLEYNGTIWNDISIRIRGDGSRVFPKKSLKVKFNSGAYIDGRTAFNLNAEWEDPTYLQQFLASRLMRESGQVCFTSEHVRLYLNGDFFGLYLLNESVDEHFFATRDMDPNGTTYKAALDGSSLSIFDQTHYHWEQKTGPDINMSDLQTLIDEINWVPQSEYGSFANQTFMRDEVVNIIAMNELLSLGSTYYHNYFMYHDLNSGKWMMLPWDMDKTLLYYGHGYPYHRSSRNWTPEADNPYHEKAIHDDDLLSEIRTRIASLESTIFNLSHIQPIIDSIQNEISSSVEEDVTDDVSDIGFWNTKINDYKNHLSQRVNHLLGQIDEYPRNFTVERVHVFEPNAQLELHWTPSVSPIQRPITYRFVLGSAPNLEASALIVEENISDTLVTFNTPSAEGQYFYKVQAYDGVNLVDGFDSYNPIFITNDIPPLVINEINYNSAPQFNTQDWIEIYNPLSYSVSMEGWTLKDDQNDHVFVFPNEFTIDPDEYIIVARNKAVFNTLVSTSSTVVGDLDFGFGNAGDAVRLFHSTGSLVDEVSYTDDSPWPTAADGDGPTLELLSPELDNSDPINWQAWENRNGTPGAVNFDGVGIHELEEQVNDLSVFPNPLRGTTMGLTINTEQHQQATIEIFDAVGNVVFSNEATFKSGKTAITITHGLSTAGVYLCRLTTTTSTYNCKLIFIGN